jgi:hypothetical protein
MPPPEAAFQGRQHQLHHRVSGVGIGAGGVVPGGLVKRQVEQRRPRGDRPAVHLDRGPVRVNFRPKRGDGLAVDLDAPCQDERFGVAAGCDAGGGEYLLQAIEHTVAPIL